MPDNHPTTIREVRLAAATHLREAGIETAALDARVLLAHVLGITQTGLLIRDPDPISDTDLHHYQHLIAQRATGMPIAYLIGEREFMGLRFQTTPDVLVPRPDTEPLVEWALAWLADHPTATVADIGTGSGAIAIAIAYHAPESWTGRVIATDLSEQALAVATTNADVLLSPPRRARLSLRQGDLTQPLTAPVDLLLANLPYLTPAQISTNPALDHEPRLALDGGGDGLDLVRIVIADLARVLAPHGAAGFEIDPSQAVEVQRLLTLALPQHHIAVVPDLAGDNRHIVAWSADPDEVRDDA